MKLREASKRHGWAVPALGIISLMVGVLGGTRVSLATQELSQARVANATPSPSPWVYFPYVTKDLPPTPTPTPITREWLIPEDLPCVDLEEAEVSPGQTYFRLVRAEWLNEQQSQGRHHIYVEVLDEAGSRLVGAVVRISWADGEDNIPVLHDKVVEFGMSGDGTLCSYSAQVTGLPSDRVVGMGLGTPEHPDLSIHTCFNLTFQRTTR